MSNTDLPEPTRKSFTPEEKISRQWNLLVVFLTAVAAYSVLHKLLIPTALKFTTLNQTPYSQIDWWFIHPVVFAILLQRNRQNSPWISFLAGIAILYGGYEIFESSQGRNVGWLIFSRLLSAVPLAIGSGYLMTQRSLGGSVRAAWLGALCLTLFITYREFVLAQRAIPQAPQKAVSGSKREIPAEENTGCGAQELTIKKGVRPLGVRQISIEECGLSPSSLVWDKGILEISNRTGQAVNLHFFLHQPPRTQSKWNILIHPNSNATREVVLAPGTAGMLISDSSPKGGIVSFVPSTTEEDWTFKRKPIAIERSK